MLKEFALMLVLTGPNVLGNGTMEPMDTTLSGYGWPWIYIRPVDGLEMRPSPIDRYKHVMPATPCTEMLRMNKNSVCYTPDQKPVEVFVTSPPLPKPRP